MKLSEGKVLISWGGTQEASHVSYKSLILIGFFPLSQPLQTQLPRTLPRDPREPNREDPLDTTTTPRNPLNQGTLPNPQREGEDLPERERTRKEGVSQR
jgi:hypothetical protein